LEKLHSRIRASWTDPQKGGWHFSGKVAGTFWKKTRRDSHFPPPWAKKVAGTFPEKCQPPFCGNSDSAAIC
jgi:hypothetical protein